MTAQTNDPLNAFAYPQSDNTATTQATTPVQDEKQNDQSAPVTDPSTSQTLNTPVNDPALSQSLSEPVDEKKLEGVRGNMLEGPQPVDPDPALLEKPVETPVEPQLPSEEVKNETLDTPVMEAPKDDSMQQGETKEKEEHLSPLQALAKKLAELKEELTNDHDETLAPQTQPILDTTLPTEPEKTTENAVTPEVKNEQIVEQAPATENTQNIGDVNSADFSGDNNATPLVETPVEQVQNSVTPEVSTTPTVESPVEPVQASVVPEISSTPIDTPSDDTTQAKSTLEQIFPEVAPSSQTPVTPAEQVSPSAVIDENDNSVVDPAKVETETSNTKYPLNINKILDIAIERNASDIQISVGYPVMIRIDGSLIAVNEHIVSPLNAEELIMPVLSEQKKELLEVNREVDLAYSPLHSAEARFRINAYYSKGNLTAAFRLIPSKIRTIEELMLPPIYNQLIKMGQGLVLVTGPTGHGKSTTLAAMLQSINMTRSVHMITIEDPIEYMFQPSKAVIDQREMHDDTHSWTVALKSALRQDPDVILVGEMRDYETIASTITLAETGHLVFATLHTNSASQTVDRIIDVFPENQQAQIRTQLANILEAVVAQRLIPIEGGGRRAVSEIMLGNPAVRNLIREGKTHQIDNVIRTSSDIGMVSLEQSLVKLVRDGLITMERAQEYAVHPEEVVRLLKS